MAKHVVVAKFFTQEDALNACDELVSAGFDPSYEPPQHAGNYMIDWNISTPHFAVLVERSRAEEAATHLGFEWQDEEEVETSDLDAEEMAAQAEEKRRKIFRSAYATSIMSTLLPLIAPYALWRLSFALPLVETSSEKRKIIACCVFMLLGTLFFFWILSNLLLIAQS